MIRFSLCLIFVLAFTAIASSKSACPMDLKACEDGSYVGRDPQTCEFIACKPTPISDSSSSSSDDQGSDSPSPSCNKDLFLCLDGSFVGRNPKDCSFLPCPSSNQDSSEDNNDNNNNSEESSESSEGPIVCTDDLFLCPDGSLVGRDPQTCAYLPCPNNNNNNAPCKDDLFLCPDGSFVGRDPQTCMFLTCKAYPSDSSSSSYDSESDSDSYSESDDYSSDDGASIAEAISTFVQSVDFNQYILSVQSSTLEYVSVFYPWMKMRQQHHQHQHHSNPNKEVILVYLNMNTPPQYLPHRYESFPVFYVVQDYNDYTCAFRPVLCPDGSYVSLIGENCNYAACYEYIPPIQVVSEDEDGGIIGVVLATLVFPLGIIMLGLCVCYCRRRSSKVCRKVSNWKGYSEDKAALLPQIQIPTPFPSKKSTQQEQPQLQPQQQVPVPVMMNSPQIQQFMIPSPPYGTLPSFPALNPYFMPVDQNGNYQFPMVFQPPTPVGYPMYNQQGQQ